MTGGPTSGFGIPGPRLPWVEAYRFARARRYLIRDRDSLHGQRVTRRIAGLGIEEVVTALASPWQNAYAGRMIGTPRREVLDHVIILTERHLKRLRSSYLDYCNPWLPHRSLEQDTPNGRRVRTAEPSNVIELPAVHGLHHIYIPKTA